MSITFDTVVWCDHPDCYTTTSGMWGSSEEAEVAVEAAGWAVTTTGAHYCPGHHPWSTP